MRHLYFQVAGRRVVRIDAIGVTDRGDTAQQRRLVQRPFCKSQRMTA